MKEEMKTGQVEMKATLSAILQQKSLREETKACPEKWEAIPEETEVKAELETVLMKRKQWKLSEHWRTDLGTCD
jgi:hypothetical protein